MQRTRVGLVVVALLATACGGGEVADADAPPTLVAQPTETVAPSPEAAEEPSPEPTEDETVGEAPSPSQGDGGEGLETTSETEPPASPTTATDTLTTPTDPREAAALAWLEAVHDGDTATAWALTGPYTQDQTEEADKAALFGELAEGAGQFHVAQDQQVFVSDADPYAVVTIRGLVSREGFDELDALALPMVEDQGQWKVEWRPGPANIEWGISGTNGQSIRAYGPPVADIRMYVDGVQIDPEITLDDSQGDPRAEVYYQAPNGGVGITVTVVFIGDLPGVLQADAFAHD